MQGVGAAGANAAPEVKVVDEAAAGAKKSPLKSDEAAPAKDAEADARGRAWGMTSLVANAMQKGAEAQDAAMSFGAQTGGGRDSKDTPAAGVPAPDKGDSGVDVGLGIDFGLAGMNLPAAVYANGSGSWLSVRV